MTERTREESDQLPEEGPSEQVEDDIGAGASAREGSQRNAGARDDADADSGQATGNPKNAG